MSLHYGHSSKLLTPETTTSASTKTLHYNFTYASLSDGRYKTPLDLNSGYPVPFVFGGDYNSNTKLTLLGHRFDDDGPMNTLTVKYVLEIIEKDGSQSFVDLKEIDMTIKRVGATFFYLLNESFIIKDYFSNIDQIAYINVLIQRTSNVSYGNESVLDVAVEY